MDTSIKNGETIRAGWETFSGREEMLRKECGMTGETFYPEDGYIAPERQAEDKARAGAKEEQRKKDYTEPVFKTKPRGGQRRQSDWSWREEDGQWEKGYYRERNYYAEEPMGAETERTGRRILGSRDQLVEAEKIRLRGIKKNEERNERENQRREKERDAPPRKEIWQDDKMKHG